MARFLLPKIVEKPKKIDSKRDQKIDQLLDRFFVDLGSVLDANLELYWPPFTTQEGPRGLQDRSKTLPRRSKSLAQTAQMAQDGQRRFQTCPGALLTSILLPPGLDFEDFLT